MTRLAPSRHELRLEIGFASECGKRADNQDYAAARIGRPCLDARRDAVIAVADGVGGHKGGREAAELTVRCFFDGFFALPGSLGVRQAAARSLDAINSWIVAQGRADPRLEGMATTFTALILSGRAGHCVHVGDSRLYRLHDGALEPLTEDHVLGAARSARCRAAPSASRTSRASTMRNFACVRMSAIFCAATASTAP